MGPERCNGPVWHATGSQCCGSGPGVCAKECMCIFGSPGSVLFNGPSCSLKPCFLPRILNITSTFRILTLCGKSSWFCSRGGISPGQDAFEGRTLGRVNGNTQETTLTVLTFIYPVSHMLSLTHAKTDTDDHSNGPRNIHSSMCVTLGFERQFSSKSTYILASPEFFT